MSAVTRKKYAVSIAVFAIICLCIGLGVWHTTARAEDSAKTVASVIEYADTQVVSYGKLLASELDNKVKVKYSDDSEGEEEIEFTEIPAQTGVNVNFTSVDVAGVVKGTDIPVKITVITMPDDLIYFINSGSRENEDNEFKTGIDPDFARNQTVFDYYGDTLINKGVADQKSSRGGNTWGYYSDSKDAIWSATEDATFPYNTLLWKPENYPELGYMLTGLTGGAQYRIFIGTLSHWHARSVNITFNGTVVGADTLRIDVNKGFTVFENVPADSTGKIDIYMKGANTNEPNLTFIAVQSMDTPYSMDVPGDLEAASTIGMKDHTVTLTGVQAGAKVQLYNAARPYAMLYEEIADEAKLADGKYTVDFVTPFSGVLQFYAVQMHGGGVSNGVLITVTDIEGFQTTVLPEGYTAGTAAVGVKAHASSGIASWSYRKGEFGEITQFDLDLPYEIDTTFTVTENGDYVVQVISGVGVSYTETITVSNIDVARPVINVTPSSAGFTAGNYNLNVSVTGVAPIVAYTLYKNGAAVVSEAAAPSTVKITEEGDYTFCVTNAAGLTAVRTIRISDRATTATVTKQYRSRTLSYTFGDNDDHKVASVSAHEVTESGVSRVTVAAGNSMDVYNAGTYVITVTTDLGAVEMFALNVRKSDFSAKADGISKGTALGVGLGVGLGGAALAAAAVVTVLLLTKRKKTQK